MAKEQAGTQGGRPHVGRRLLSVFVSPSSYGMVLLLIIATYILAASLSASTPHSAALLLAQAVTVWFVLRTSRVRRPARIAADVLLVLATLIALGMAFGGDTNSTRAGVSLLSCLLYLVAPVAIIRQLVSRDAVDVQTMLGAIAAYLMIGMFFTFAYVTVGALQDASFFGPQGDGTVPQVLFFSFTTLTTTGYGNLVPASNPGQSLSVAEMIFGQLFLITALGKVASAWRPRRWSAVGPESDVRPEESDASAGTP